MPKIDPITGCPVMTNAEFWASEAQREGKGRTGGDLQAEFFEDQDNERKAEEARLRDPKVLLPLIQKECKDWNEADPEAGVVPIPTSIVEVLSVNTSDSYRGSGMSTTCKVRCRKGRKTITGTLRVESYYSSGSFYEPPDWDGNITFAAD